MNKKKKQFWIASVSLVGAVVGVGIFGVPYVISQVGLVPALFYFFILGGIQILQNLFFAETAIACKEDHGLPGLARLYLGETYGRVGGAALILGYWASLTAYVAVGGTLLAVILQPLLGGSIFVYSIIWGILGAFALHYGMKTISKLEFIGTIGLVVALLGILGFSLPHIELANMPLFDWIDPIIPYGVILFSLGGMTAVPEMEEMVEGRRGDYRKSIILGTIIAMLITMAFGFIVWGVSGDQLTKDAVTGLKAVLGSSIGIPAAIAGFLAVATSYFATAANVKDTFNYDFKLNRNIAWLLAVMPPIGIFLFGGRDFLSMIGLSGAVFGGVLAVLVGLLYLKIRRKRLVRRKPLGIHPAFTYVCMAILSIGAVLAAGDYIKGLL